MIDASNETIWKNTEMSSVVKKISMNLWQKWNISEL